MNIYRLSANVDDFPWLDVWESHLSPPLGFHFRGSDSLSRDWVAPIVHRRVDEGLPRGAFSDFPYVPGVPVLSQRATDTLLDLLAENGELLPLRCEEGAYHAYNVTTVVDALDEDRSVLKRFPSSGRVMEVDAFVFFPDRLRGHSIFKIPQLPKSTVLVTDAFVARVRQAGLTGFVFEKVWPTAPAATAGPEEPESHPALPTDLEGDTTLVARSLEAGIRAEMEDAAAAAAEQLGVPSYAEPEGVVRAILDFVEGARPLDGEELDDTAVALGSLWGEQVRRSLGWEWVELVEDGEFRGYAITSPDRALAVLPIVHLRKILRDPDRDNTVLLLLNMFVAGTTPPSSPGQLRLLS